jgi:hypothetical protein
LSPLTLYLTYVSIAVFLSWHELSAKFFCCANFQLAGTLVRLHPLSYFQLAELSAKSFCCANFQLAGAVGKKFLLRNFSAGGNCRQKVFVALFFSWRELSQKDL